MDRLAHYDFNSSTPTDIFSFSWVSDNVHVQVHVRINGTDAFLNEPTCAKGDCEEKYVFPMVCSGTGKGPWELNRRGG